MSLTFPQGLVGCEHWQHFTLVETPGEPIQELICQDEPGIGFLVTEAGMVLPGYSFELSDADAQTLDCEDPSLLRVFCTLSLNPEPPMLTANLLGPLVINVANQLGKQVVLVNSGYSFKYPVVDRLPEKSHAHSH